MADPRARGRELAHEAMARGDATGWFEQLYVESQRDGTPISWLDLEPNPYLVAWLAAGEASGAAAGASGASGAAVGEAGAGAGAAAKPLRGRALVVGCGYGDDAELLATFGLDVTAFDVAPSAIARCRERWPMSPVRYVVADALRPPGEWQGAFDFVFEAYTVQVLFGEARRHCAREIGGLVAPGGTLLVVARSRKPDDPEGPMPWPLTRAELDEFAASGLQLAHLDEVLEPGDPPVPRFVGEFHRA